jgi:hypothetical protein
VAKRKWILTRPVEAINKVTQWLMGNIFQKILKPSKWLRENILNLTIWHWLERNETRRSHLLFFVGRDFIFKWENKIKNRDGDPCVIRDPSIFPSLLYTTPCHGARAPFRVILFIWLFSFSFFSCLSQCLWIRVGNNIMCSFSSARL